MTVPKDIILKAEEGAGEGTESVSVPPRRLGGCGESRLSNPGKDSLVGSCASNSSSGKRSSWSLSSSSSSSVDLAAKPLEPDDVIDVADSGGVLGKAFVVLASPVCNQDPPLVPDFAAKPPNPPAEKPPKPAPAVTFTGGIVVDGLGALETPNPPNPVVEPNTGLPAGVPVGVVDP